MGAGTRADNKKCFTFQSTNNMAFNGQAKRAKPITKDHPSSPSNPNPLATYTHTTRGWEILAHIHVRSSIIVKKNFILKNARTSINYIALSLGAQQGEPGQLEVRGGPGRGLPWPPPLS